MRFCILLFSVLLANSVLAEDFVIEDEGVGMTREELEYVVKYWTPQMQQAAAVDAGDRIELLNMSLAAKKIAEDVDSIGREADPEGWWQLQFAIRNRQRQFVTSAYLKGLEVPDMAALAEERYTTEKDKYARVPERRMSSHILFRCQLPSCKFHEKRPEVLEVLEQLNAGADFEEMVKKHSDDPGSRNKGGKFDRWLRIGEPHVAPPYIGGLFDIAEVGQYSGLVETQFGIHILRLDGIQEEHYLPFEEVRAKIIATLEKDYRKLAAKEFDARYMLTPGAVMDEAVLDELFEQYQPQEVLPAPSETESTAESAAESAAEAEGQAAAPEPAGEAAQ